MAATACGRSGGAEAQPAASGHPASVPSTSAETAASPPEGVFPTEPAPSSSPPPAATASTGSGVPAAASSAPAALPASLRGREWTRLPTGARLVALTFDAGANATGVPKILAALRRAGAPATFFLTGRWVDRYPSYARAIGAHYPVGNHTFDHPHLPQLSDAAVRRQVRLARARILARTGRDPRPLFRFPFGESDARTLRLVNALGYGSIRWTVDTLGWEGSSGGQSVARVVARVLAGLRPGEIVLMHVGSSPDGSTLDADALPRILRALRARGFGFTTIARFLPR